MEVDPVRLLPASHSTWWNVVSKNIKLPSYQVRRKVHLCQDCLLNFEAEILSSTLKPSTGSVMDWTCLSLSPVQWVRAAWIISFLGQWVWVTLLRLLYFAGRWRKREGSGQVRSSAIQPVSVLGGLFLLALTIVVYFKLYGFMKLFLNFFLMQVPVSFL